MRKEKRTRKRIWEPLGDEVKSSKERGGRGEHKVSKRSRKQTENIRVELIKSSRRTSKAEMQQDE